MPEVFTPMEGATGSIVDLNGVQLYYEEYGQGEPLVLLHGFGGSGKNWYPFVTELSLWYRLLVVDLPGHGRSSHPGRDFTHRGAAASLFLLLDHLGIPRCRAMGISSGGMTLLHMASSQPQRILSQVLISATSHFPEQARTIMRRVSLSTMPHEVRRMYEACASRGEDQVLRLIHDFQALGNNDDDMNFSGETLAAISAKTLLVHGDRDNFFPVEIPVFLYRSLRNSALWIIPFGEHVPIFDRVDEFSKNALQFLNGG